MMIEYHEKVSSLQEVFVDKITYLIEFSPFYVKRCNKSPKNLKVEIVSLERFG